MDVDDAILTALTDLRAAFPAMQVRTEHVVLGDTQTVFRATIVLPSGAEATGYGAVPQGGTGAIRAAEDQALARALALLDIDLDNYAVDADLSEDSGDGADAEPDRSGSGLFRMVAEDQGSDDPYNLGPTPTAAAIAAATGMRLGIRPDAAQQSEPESDRSSAPVMAAAPVPVVTAPAEPAAQRSTPPATMPQRPARSEGARSEAEEDAGVSHSAFWRWAADQGVPNRTSVESLIGRSMAGMRPAQVRDLIIAALEEGDQTDA